MGAAGAGFAAGAGAALGAVAIGVGAGLGAGFAAGAGVALGVVAGAAGAAAGLGVGAASFDAAVGEVGCSGALCSDITGITGLFADGVIIFDRLGDLVKENDLAAIQHTGHIAMLFDRGYLVRDHQQGRGAFSFQENPLAFLAEGSVPHGGQFVDEIKIETNGHTEPKGQFGRHAGRIGLDRHIQIVLQFGKVLYEGRHLLDIRFVDAADKAQVLPTGEATVETAAEADGPGDPAGTLHSAAIWRDGAADDAHQGGLSRPVAPQDADINTGDEVHAQVVKDQTAPGFHAVSFGHVAQADHCVTLRRT